MNDLQHWKQSEEIHDEEVLSDIDKCLDILREVKS
jgi:hypothetical protein